MPFSLPGTRLACLVMWLYQASAIAAVDIPIKRAQFARVEGSVQIDGNLEDLSWQASPVFSHFFEIFPSNLASPSVTTDARFLFDDENIYIAIRAHDPSPSQIRASFVRRDEVDSDQDYVEVMLDPMNGKRNAVLFRVNAIGTQTDGQWSEDSQLRDMSPDFEYDVATAITDGAWTAEFRIPTKSLRIRSDISQTWTFVIFRNLPRSFSATVASARIPRGANCTLCYATELDGFTVTGASRELDVVPYLAYTQNSAGRGAHAGVDFKWQLSPDTILDLTLKPDFSQVEADDLELTANTRFALALAEKRPFFLEGSDLLSTPISAVYSRAFTDPDAGVRITKRTSAHEYTALLLRDAGNGTTIEPGPIRSQSVSQELKSTAFAGRYRHHLSDTYSYGLLASSRLNEDGSHNELLGVDTVWTPSNADRVAAQAIFSATRNPNRHDLTETWNGQRIKGTASLLRWQHTDERWFSTVSYRDFSSGFRAWNGFVPRTGVSILSTSSGLYFYPKSRLLTRISPTVSLARVDAADGETLSQLVSPGIIIEAPFDTTVSLTLAPNAKEFTTLGLRASDSWSASVTATPAAWMPGMTIAASGGEVFDNLTGELGHGFTIQALAPLRILQRLEVDVRFAHQSLTSQEDRRRIFGETNLQIDMLWHFSRSTYARLALQNSHFRSLRSTESRLDESGTNSTTSLLVSFQKDTRTRLFIGARANDGIQSDAEMFAKFSYML